jgi:putative addiction module CopG family antidote
MTNSLPADLAQFVQHELAVGRYHSVEELVCDSLRLLRSQRDRRDGLRREIAPALERLDRGEGIVVKETEIRGFLQQILADATADLGTGEQPVA